MTSGEDYAAYLMPNSGSCLIRSLIKAMDQVRNGSNRLTDWRCRCRNTPASVDKVTSITFKGLLNFTNSQQLAGPDSGNCLINSLINNEGQPMQEVLGEVTELFVDNIDQHPYHHHVQPYQIVALGNDSDKMNAWWRVRRFACFACRSGLCCAMKLPRLHCASARRLQRRLAVLVEEWGMFDLSGADSHASCTGAIHFSRHRHASSSLHARCSTIS